MSILQLKAFSIIYHMLKAILQETTRFDGSSDFIKECDKAFDSICKKVLEA